MEQVLKQIDFEFARHRSLAERAMEELSDDEFFHRPAPHVNSVAIVVKHLAGNLASRWSDFLNTDGEKPSRDRDAEFAILDQDTRPTLMAAWQQGWTILMETISELDATQLSQMVTIRDEPHAVSQALLRSMTHVAYHVGQILYVVRLLRPDASWATVPPGHAAARPGTYLRK